MRNNHVLLWIKIEKKKKTRFSNDKKIKFSDIICIFENKNTAIKKIMYFSQFSRLSCSSQ